MTHELVTAGSVLPATVIDRGGALAVADVSARVRRIQEVMGTLMKRDTHYGVIPGTQKPSLYQPGAELLCMTFRIAPSPQVDDLSTLDAIRYRITMRSASQVTGEALGEGVGECSSDEEKYRWHRPTCDEEFADTPDDQKREKWMRGKNGAYKAKQIRTSPADIANTVLKMAYKRALISMTRTVLACSDIFAQDLEDLPEEIRESVTEGDTPAIHPPQRKPEAPAPSPASLPLGPTGTATTPPPPSGQEPDDPFGDFGGPPPESAAPTSIEEEVRTGKFSKGGDLITEAQRKRMFAVAMGKGWSKDAYREQIQRFGFNRDNDVTTVAYDVIVKVLQDGPR